MPVDNVGCVTLHAAAGAREVPFSGERGKIFEIANDHRVSSGFLALS